VRLAWWFVAAVVASVVLSVGAVYALWRSDVAGGCTVTYPAAPGGTPTVEAC
jgi:hypothetical protein